MADGMDDLVVLDHDGSDIEEFTVLPGTINRAKTLLKGRLHGEDKHQVLADLELAAVAAEATTATTAAAEDNPSSGAGAAASTVSLDQVIHTCIIDLAANLEKGHTMFLLGAPGSGKTAMLHAALCRLNHRYRYHYHHQRRNTSSSAAALSVSSKPDALYHKYHRVVVSPVLYDNDAARMRCIRESVEEILRNEDGISYSTAIAAAAAAAASSSTFAGKTTHRDFEDDNDQEEEEEQQDPVRREFTAELEATKPVLAALLKPLARIQDGRNVQDRLVILIDKVHLCAPPTGRQIFLYTILELHAMFPAGRISIVATSSYTDVYTLLEKRVASRFPPRIIHALPPSSAESLISILTHYLQLPDTLPRTSSSSDNNAAEASTLIERARDYLGADYPFRAAPPPPTQPQRQAYATTMVDVDNMMNAAAAEAVLEEEDWRAYADAFNRAIAEAFQHPRVLPEMTSLFQTTLNMHRYVNMLELCIVEVGPDHPYVTHKDVLAAIASLMMMPRQGNPRFDMVRTVTGAELALLWVVLRRDLIPNSENMYTFDQLVRLYEVELRNTKYEALARKYHYTRPVLYVAFERLLRSSVLRPVTTAQSRTSKKVSSLFWRVAATLPTDELRAGLAANPNLPSWMTV